MGNYYGTSGDDRLVGTNADDYLWGGGGDDMLWGKGGANELRPGLGNDTVGGGGDDTVSYMALNGSYSPAITVDLSSKVAKDGDQVSLVYEGYSYVDTLKNIEHVTGSSSGDKITGDSGANKIQGYGGNDTLDGGAGSDTAVYKGDLSDYDISYDSGTKKVYVTDKRSLAERKADDVHYYAHEGTDELKNFEKYKFGGTTYTLDQILPDDYADYVGDLTEPYGNVQMGSKAKGEIERGWDSDAFKVYLYAGTEYRFYLNGADTYDGTLPDPYLRLYTSAGTWQATDNNDGEGKNAYISYTPTSSGTYYLQAWGYSSSETGTYTLIAKSGDDDHLVGTWMKDYFWGGDGADTIDGGGGDDHLYGDAGNDVIHGGSGNDWIDGGYGHDWMDGGDGHDYLYGYEGNDTIKGGAGNDDLYGGNGHDDLAGNDGHDWVYGGGGNDSVYGGNDDDHVYGDEGNDHAYGGAGNDTVSGGDGNDKVYGDKGDDDIAGGNGKDMVWGGDGNDTVYGGNDADKVWGGKGHDYVYGGAGDDKVYGDQGNDYLYGNKGKDKLYAGGGNDRLWGGEHADHFVFGKGHGKNTIEDFENNYDKIVITKGANHYGQLSVTDTGPDVEVAWANTKVIIEDTKWSDIGSEDFLFI